MLSQFKEVAQGAVKAIKFVAEVVEWLSSTNKKTSNSDFDFKFESSSKSPTVSRESKKKCVSEEPLFHGYAILCDDSNVYVGRINAYGNKTIEERYKEHEDGKGSEWTKKHKPIRLLEREMFQDKWAEDTMLFRYMEKYSYKNVRGGSYSQMEFTQGQEYTLAKKFKSVDDACFKCGSREHFAKDCGENQRNSNYGPIRKKQRIKIHEKAVSPPAPPPPALPPPPSYEEVLCSDFDIEPILDRELTSNKEQKQKEQQDTRPCFRCGKIGHWLDKCPEPPKQKQTRPCFRCGRTEHWADKCQETTTIDGGGLHKFSKWMFKPRTTT